MDMYIVYLLSTKSSPVDFYSIVTSLQLHGWTNQGLKVSPTMVDFAQTPNKKHILNPFLTTTFQPWWPWYFCCSTKPIKYSLPIFKWLATRGCRLSKHSGNICHNMPKRMKWSEVILWYRHDISCLQIMQHGEMIVMELLVSRGNTLKQRMHWKHVTTWFQQ